MAFTNTVETVGDAALTRSIIDRSITELNCNITTSIRQYAFRACAALASVNFPSATSVALGAFWQCTALKKAEFGSAVAFANNAFYGCTQLSAVILRSTDQLCTITGTPFAASAIASGTGYIYVPAALVDQYKSSWSAYAAQIRAIEDYIEITDPYSWAAVAKAIDNGTYATVYKIGDLVPLDMGSEGQIDMQIVAFDADDLADGSGKAAISWISKGLLKTYMRMNPALSGTTEGTGTIGGWEKCEMRTYLQNTIYPLIPYDVQSMIVAVTKGQFAYDTTGSKFTQTTTDRVWLPSYREVIDGNTNEGSEAEYCSLFTNNSSRIKRLQGTAILWRLRSAATSEYFRTINSNGTSNGIEKTNTYHAIPLCFCT